LNGIATGGGGGGGGALTGISAALAGIKRTATPSSVIVVSAIFLMAMIPKANVQLLEWNMEEEVKLRCD
jgi:hypothetical protein